MRRKPREICRYRDKLSPIILTRLLSKSSLIRNISCGAFGRNRVLSIFIYALPHLISSLSFSFFCSVPKESLINGNIDYSKMSLLFIQLK